MATVILILGLKSISTWANKTSDRLDLDLYAIQLEKDVNASRELLNKMVLEAVAEWSIYNVRREEESYINESRRDACLEWVIARVIENSTDTIRAQIGIGYLAETQDQYINSIKNVAMLHVLDFTIKQNTKDMSQSNIPNINIEL